MKIVTKNGVNWFQSRCAMLQVATIKNVLVNRNRSGEWMLVVQLTGQAGHLERLDSYAEALEVVEMLRDAILAPAPPAPAESQERETALAGSAETEPATLESEGE
jgi:hypothetical protein